MKSIHYDDNGNAYYNELQPLLYEGAIDTSHPDHYEYRDNEERNDKNFDHPTNWRIHRNDRFQNGSVMVRLKKHIMEQHTPELTDEYMSDLDEKGRLGYYLKEDKEYNPLMWDTPLKNTSIHSAVHNYTDPYFYNEFNKIIRNGNVIPKEHKYYRHYKAFDDLFKKLPYLSDTHVVNATRTLFLTKSEIKQLIDSSKNEDLIHWPGVVSTAMRPGFPATWARLLKDSQYTNTGRIPVVFNLKIRHGFPVSSRFFHIPGEVTNPKEMLLFNPLISKLRMLPKLVSYKGQTSDYGPFGNYRGINKEHSRLLTFAGEQT